MKKYLYYSAIVSFCICSKSFPGENYYHSVQKEIDKLENDIIQDFKFPKTPKQDLNIQQLHKFSLKLEKKFEEQKLNFNNIESSFKSIKRELASKKQSLSEEEYNKLVNSIDYSNIILKSRKEEVYSHYINSKNHLKHKVSIEDFYNRVSKTKLPGSCSIQNIKYQPNKNKFVSFEIRNNNDLLFFKIFEDDLKYNSIVSKYHLRPEDKAYILNTNFELNVEDKPTIKLSIAEDKNNNILYAYFEKIDLPNMIQSILNTKPEKKVINCQAVKRLPSNID